MYDCSAQGLPNPYGMIAAIGILSIFIRRTMTTRIGGIDIGGTKCAVTVGQVSGDTIVVLAKQRFPTPATPAAALARISDELAALLDDQRGGTIGAIGVSCGGPLDSKSGLVLSPPNLPGWDRIDVCAPLRQRFAVPVALQNDANACALAEWRWGAGRGCQSMIFLTFGTGMGAGLILDGRLYSGTNDMAGEVGHVRMSEHGPIGYGKAGSFEGFCSGGGIAQLAGSHAEIALRAGQTPSFCPTFADLPHITAQGVGEAAAAGDPLALETLGVVGRQLGRGLALLIDILNPERIVIGSIYGRQLVILEPLVLDEVRREALPLSQSVCQIVPAGLGEQVGDYASLAIASGLVRHT